MGLHLSLACLQHQHLRFSLVPVGSQTKLDWAFCWARDYKFCLQLFLSFPLRICLTPSLVIHTPACLKHEGLYVRIISICNIHAPMCNIWIYVRRCVWYKHMHTQVHVPASCSFSSPCGWILSGRNCSPTCLWAELPVTSNGPLCCLDQPRTVCCQELLCLSLRGDSGTLGALSHKA